KAVLVVRFAELWFPGTAGAHATLMRTSPGFADRLSHSPRVVRLQFDQGVKALPNAITVFTAKGSVVSGIARSGDGYRVVETPVRRLGKGAYTVRWSALSADGHVVSGVFTFGVRHRAPPATEAYGSSGPTTSEHVVR